MAKIPELTETNNFLENYRNNYNAFRINPKDNYASQDTIVTGAVPAILPMRISTIGTSINQDGKTVDKRISFTLLINPDTWNQSKTNTSPVVYTRKGWMVQMWGPNQDTISSTGKTAVMMTSPTGLDYLTREMSFSYLNFLSLLSAYRNNGYRFEDPLETNALTRVIKTIYGVEISFDNQTFMGHFNNFTIDENAETPFVFVYNIEFIISTLAPTEQVRGHYKQLPDYDSDLITGTEADPFSLTLVSDPYIKKTHTIAGPKPVVDKATEKLWGTRTGLTFDQAINRGLTDGSIQGNVVLRTLLMSDNIIWDPNAKIFKNKYGEIWIPGQTELKDFTRN
jgi:hypothetical protein